jgi:hypothetical protein
VLVALVITGASSGPIAKVTLVEVPPKELLAVTVTTFVPATEGVPEINPLEEFRLSPVGKFVETPKELGELLAVMV